MPEHLRGGRHQEIRVAVDEASLVLEDDERLSDAIGEEDVGIGDLAGDADGAAFVVLDCGGREGGILGGGRGHDEQRQQAIEKRQTNNTGHRTSPFVTCWG